MSGHKHTRGPWTFNGLATIQSEYHCIAVVHQFPGKSTLPSPAREQEEANARLIASAPDLLEELKRTLDYLKTIPFTQGEFKMPEIHAVQIAENIQAAILKAEGGGE